MPPRLVTPGIACNAATNLGRDLHPRPSFAERDELAVVTDGRALHHSSRRVPGSPSVDRVRAAVLGAYCMTNSRATHRRRRAADGQAKPRAARRTLHGQVVAELG